MNLRTSIMVMLGLEVSGVVLLSLAVWSWLRLRVSQHGLQLDRKGKNHLGNVSRVQQLQTALNAALFMLHLHDADPRQFTEEHVALIRDAMNLYLNAHNKRANVSTALVSQYLTSMGRTYTRHAQYGSLFTEEKDRSQTQ